MKKLLLIAAAAILSVTASAQTLTYGPVVGLNLSNLSVHSFDGISVNNNMRIGYMVGGFMQYRAECNWAFRAEMAYSSQGTEIDYVKDDKEYSGAIRMNYINIPLLAKYYIAKGFNIEVGPQFGFSVGNKFTSGAAMFNNASNVRVVDIAIDLGLGFDLSDRMSLGARYNVGVMNAIRKYEGENKLSKNGVVQVYVSFAL